MGAAGGEEDALETFLSSLPDAQLVAALSAQGAMPPELRLVLGMMHLSSSADAFDALAPIAQQCAPGSFARAAFARYANLPDTDLDDEVCPCPFYITP
jgi:hypothetical protein